MPLNIFRAAKRMFSPAAARKKGNKASAPERRAPSPAADAFELKTQGAQPKHHAMTDIPETTYTDVKKTLGVPRFRFLGVAFGPSKTVDKIVFFTDASGRAMGGEARVGGKKVPITGDLLIRAIENQFKHRGIEAVPKTSIKQAPDARTLKQKQFAMYCDLAAAHTFYATEREVIAACETLGVTLRVISEKPLVKDGSYRYQVDTFVPQSVPDAPVFNLYLRANHYEPLPKAVTLQDSATGQSKVLDVEDFHQAAGAQSLATREALKKAATPVAGDGSCFFHALATLLPQDAATLRAQSVAWLRTHGETYVRSVGDFHQPLIDDFLDGADRATHEAIMAAYPKAP